MQLKNKPLLSEVKRQHLCFRFFDTGDIFDITYKDHQINLIRGNQIDGSVMNLYLRVFYSDKIISTPLIGKKSPSTFELTPFGAIYEGHYEGIWYQVKLMIDDYRWDFHIDIHSDQNQTIDVIYGQDLALAHQGSVLNSEPYTVQYIDYKAFKEDLGFTLCARQNQGKTSFFQMGSFSPNVAYSTDGFQFFGLSYKKTGHAYILEQKFLPSKIYQYEFSYFALQSEKYELTKQTIEIDFYGFYHHEDHDIIKKPYEIFPTERKTWTQVEKQPDTWIKPLLDPSLQINGLELSMDQMSQLFNEMNHVESDEHGLLSFFSKNYHHVVMQKKELLVERPHGHLFIHHDLLHVSENVMSSTNFMFGIFSMHLVLGNTSFNKFSGDLRNPLNIQKISGLRIYLNINGRYHLLGLPSFYEIGATTARWYYQLEDDAIVVDAYVDISRNDEFLSIKSLNNQHYDIVITQQVLMGVSEYQYDVDYKVSGNEIIFEAPKNAMFYHSYPDLKYKLVVNQNFDIISEDEAFGSQNQHGLLIFHMSNQKEVLIKLQATMTKSFDPAPYLTYEEADQRGTDYFKSFTELKMNHPTYQFELSKLEYIVFWYTHNALTHYASPHGLEQYNGAAWGTRDVCQGPIEFFTSIQRYDIVKEIMLKVYRRQFIENGDFPQWYMFDKYYQIQAHESHGDIIIWPLRSLAHYIDATNDISILEEKVPYMSIETNQFTEALPLVHHLRSQIKAIQASFIKGTFLPQYGGGDWDDTLQPANHNLTTKMVSGWTVALLYEAVDKMSTVLKGYDQAFSDELSQLKGHIKSDYEKHVIHKGIPAGFVVFEGGQKTLLLHPDDEKTGLKYRLLPFTRSMISEIADKNQIPTYKKIIDDVFMHPDGVRLMDTAVAYHGGSKTYFTRGETAANFGREIGLQYVHAHIRYIEAMTKVGYADDAYRGLFTINPIGLKDTVPNAYYRQSNVYFSSSDAWFMDRYEAKRDFHLIKEGKVFVKGGWRLYSSGPGIYIKQLISHVLGIRVQNQNLIIDPVIPRKLDGLVVDYHFMGIKIILKFVYGKHEIEINNEKYLMTTHQEKYRDGGYVINLEILKHASSPISIKIGYQ